MRLALTSDLHGCLPQNCPRAEVLVITGDIVPGWATRDNVTAQSLWLTDVFLPWANSRPVDRVLVTWGNHDWAGQLLAQPFFGAPNLGKVELLNDRSTTLSDGTLVYGTPWTRWRGTGSWWGWPTWW